MGEVKWTKEQALAINEKGENILVAAGAGSGKTAVLIERIMNKILNEKIDIDKILVVTFTKAAASEMRERLLKSLYKEIEKNPDDSYLQRQTMLLSKANICTIDSFCLDVGCDHALLDIYLSQEKGCECIASDVNANALDQAKYNISRFHVKNVTTILTMLHFKISSYLLGYIYELLKCVKSLL